MSPVCSHPSGEDCGRRLRVVVVPTEDVVTLDPDLTDVAHERVAVDVDESDLDTLQDTTDRTEPNR